MRIFSQSQKNEMFYRQDGRCLHCNEYFNGYYEADHIRPFSLGGATDISNGQLLCSKCHKKKTKKEYRLTNNKKEKIEFRKWQRSAYNSFVSDYSIGKRNYMFIATPGAGKTFFASKMMEFLSNENYMFIVVVPNTQLRQDWSNDAQNSTNGRLQLSADAKFSKGLPINEFNKDGKLQNGMVTTYQSFNDSSYKMVIPQIHQAHRRNKKICVIFDEVHHLSMNNFWGKKCMEILQDADVHISMSGTPFRSDKSKIPFLDYASDGSVIADYKYLYKDALKDHKDGIGVVRHVVFPTQDGQVEYVKGSTGEIIKTGICLSDTNENIDNSFVNMAIHHNSKIVRTLLINAENKLDEIRSGEHKNAGGIIFCKNNKHADHIGEILENLTGEIPLVIHSGDNLEIDNISTALTEYKNGTDKWVIAVKMISEGKNIPRLRVGVWLSNVSARLTLIQSLGRILRFTKELKQDQTAYFFMPNFEYLNEFATQIKEEIQASIVEEEKEKIQIDPPIDREPKNLRQEDHLLNSHAGETNVIYDGNTFTQEEINEQEQFLFDNNLTHLNPAIFALHKKVIENQMNKPKHHVTSKVIHDAASELEYEFKESINVADEIGTKRKEANKLIARICKAMNLKYSYVNHFFNSRFISQKSFSENTITLDDIDMKIVWCKRCLNSGRLLYKDDM